MKKLFLFILSFTIFASCQYDDTAIWDEIRTHEDRIAKLEALCGQINTNISSLQAIVAALQNNDSVTSVVSIMEDGKAVGYTINFAKSGNVTIYHGKDGQDGADGENGKDGQDGASGKDGVDGKDGCTPVIGVRQDTDGIYYWTLDGEWLLDENGKKIRTTGADGKDGSDGADGKDGLNGENGKDGQDGAPGKDGANGKDGITPKLKVEDEYWYISYDNGQTWEILYEYGGDNDSLFSEVESDGKYLYLTLSDGSKFTLPYYTEARLISFGFTAKTNPRWLSSDLECEFRKDNKIETTPYRSPCPPPCRWSRHRWRKRPERRKCRCESRHR